MIHLHQASSQICSLSAATGNAFTMVLAGFAFTLISWPKAILLPALVAGFLRVLILQRPGIVKMPDFFTSVVPISARLASALPATDFLISHALANASAIAPFDMAVT